jgi:hypothetical protein
MTDSSYYAPGGTNASPLTVTTAINNFVADRTYFPRFPKGTAVQFGSAMSPIKFDVAVAPTHYSYRVENNPTLAQGNPGFGVRAFIYNSNEFGVPHTLRADLGYSEVIAFGETGAEELPFYTETLAGNNWLQANELYFIGAIVLPLGMPGANLTQFACNIPGQLRPYSDEGLTDSEIANGNFGKVGYSDATTNWFAFDLENDELPADICMNTVAVDHAIRIGLKMVLD